MRFKTAAVFVGAVFLLAGAPAALAKSAGHQFWGEVSHVDATARSLAVKEHNGKKQKEMTFSLAPDVRILQEGKARGLTDLKAGERVKVDYANEGTLHRANRIEVLPPKTARAGQPMKAGY